MVRPKRRGIIVILMAILLVILLAVIAFTVDLGFISVARTELQSAADSAALAGVADLPRGESFAQSTALDYIERNTNLTTPPATSHTTGQWDFKTGTFTPGKTPLDALRVQVETQNQSLFFGKVLGTNSFNTGATATAVVRPRDFVLVLDYSGSMNSENKISQLKSSVALFFDVLDDLGNQDKVSFIRYSDHGQNLASLTNDFVAVNSVVQSNKAGGYTNIAGGMSLARQEFLTNGRTNATKMMVLMTDGLANRPTGVDPVKAVINEAYAIDALGIDLYTISFGSDADQSLMQQVADIGNDVHFAVTGSESENGELLREVFVKIANKRKVVLVE